MSSTARRRYSWRCADERAERGLPGEQHVGGVFPGTRGERIARPAMTRPASGVSIIIRRSTGGRRHRPSLRIAEPSRAATSRSPSPSRTPRRWGRDVRKAGNGQRERAEPGPGVEADEHQGADAGGQQAGHQHELEHRAAQPRGLHQQERPDQRRAEQRADGGEATGRAHHGWMRPSVPLDQADAQAPRPPPSAISGASGPSTAPRPGWPARPVRCREARRARRALARLEAVGGRVAAGPGRYSIVRATSRPPSNSGGSGHHGGSP